MSFNTGTITSATPATDLQVALEAELTAHAAWSFVKEVVISTNTYRVWKCLGTVNSFGTDFFMFMWRATAGTGNLNVRMCEGFDSGTDLATKIVTGYAQSTVPDATDFTFGSPTTTHALSVSQFHNAVLSTNTSGMEWYAQVSNDKVVFGTKYGTTDTSIYAGLFDSFVPSDPFPICLGGVSAGSSSRTFGVSRQPNVTVGDSNTWGMNIAPYGGNIQNNNFAVDKYHGKAIAERVLLKPFQQVPASYGYLRGLLKDVVAIYGPSSARTGDTIQIGGITYTLFSLNATIWSPGYWANNTA